MDALTPVQQKTYEHIAAKREIAQREQILVLQQSVQLYFIIKLAFMEIVHEYGQYVSKSSAVDYLCCKWEIAIQTIP